MAPILLDGDAVIVEPVTMNRIRKFDIVVYYQNSSLMCHYVWKIAPDGVICSSYQFGGCERIEASMILGRLSSHRIRGIRKLFCYLGLNFL